MSALSPQRQQQRHARKPPSADILAEVLRLVDRFDGVAGHPACRNHVVRATARPSFVKAHADQMAHFAAAD